MFVTTRHNTHAEYVLKALKAGKHVLVEKPLALESSRARELAERAEAVACILQVGLSEWYNPAWRAAVRRAGTVAPGERATCC